MGIVSAVVGQSADVSVNALSLLFEDTFCESGADPKLDQHSCTDLHLCRALHCDGNRCWGSPIRAIWPTE
jgi:hypothetical protein